MGNGLFGLDALRNLTTGMDEFLEDPNGRWRQYRSLGPAVLGCVPWFDDEQLLGRVDRFASSCILITKPDAKTQRKASFDQLKQRAASGPGFPSRVFFELDHMASRYVGEPEAVHPYSPQEHVDLQTFRSLGYRKAGKTPVPIIHAKMFLLGHLWWHDEGALGEVADVIGFTPKRLWLGSANATKSSRKSLEYGIWLDDAQVLREARNFMIMLLKYSESLDSPDDVFEPEFLERPWDDDAFYEYMREFGSYPDEPEDG
ncbi:hypothetical protein [Nonomuraea sp. NPDC049784]|uniref:hypothetical protein n=1 Tax=Nonomuraea sp. NPDC049784 TaxID=3154361 RepID=UPI0034035014